MATLIVGQKAPEFSLPTLQAGRFSLRDALRRGPVVVAFFKIDCPVCQYAVPYLVRLHQAYKGAHVTVVGVSQNSKSDTAAFIKEFGITFPITLDDPANYRVSNAYGLTHVPTVFCLGSDSEIEVQSVGWVKAEMATINGRLADVVKAKGTPLFRAGEQVSEWRPG